jgi:hypothetical protein
MDGESDMDASEMRELLQGYLEELDWSGEVTKDVLMGHLAGRDEALRTMVNEYVGEGVYANAASPRHGQDVCPLTAAEPTRGDGVSPRTHAGGLKSRRDGKAMNVWRESGLGGGYSSWRHQQVSAAPLDSPKGGRSYLLAVADLVAALKAVAAAKPQAAQAAVGAAEALVWTARVTRVTAAVWVATARHATVVAGRLPAFARHRVACRSIFADAAALAGCSVAALARTAGVLAPAGLLVARLAGAARMAHFKVEAVIGVPAAATLTVGADLPLRARVVTSSAVIRILEHVHALAATAQEAAPSASIVAAAAVIAIAGEIAAAAWSFKQAGGTTDLATWTSPVAREAVVGIVHVHAATVTALLAIRAADAYAVLARLTSVGIAAAAEGREVLWARIAHFTGPALLRAAADRRPGQEAAKDSEQIANRVDQRFADEVRAATPDADRHACGEVTDVIAEKVKGTADPRGGLGEREGWLGQAFPGSRVRWEQALDPHSVADEDFEPRIVIEGDQREGCGVRSVPRMKQVSHLRSTMRRPIGAYERCYTVLPALPQDERLRSRGGGVASLPEGALELPVGGVLPGQVTQLARRAGLVAMPAADEPTC